MEGEREGGERSIVRGGEGWVEKGNMRTLEEVGISSSSAAWTPEPQCGVPVHILKSATTVWLSTGFFVCSSRAPLPPSPLLCQLLHLYFYLSLPVFPVALTSPDWVLQQHADESGWSQDSPLTPPRLHLHPPARLPLPSADCSPMEQ